ncbi:glutaredoxin-like protein [Corynebacterium diphtheriae]|nr:glutaredoxin-like protein [Corynebacterium diphtheriae]
MSDNNHVAIYAADWCPFCQRLIKALNRTETPFTLIDVEADEAASEWVKSVNNGDCIVPTVKYSDGTTATNPPASDVRKKLEELAG